MSYHPVVCGSAASWAVPAVRGEFQAQLNRRWRDNWTNRRRIRMFGAGGAVGLNTADLGADYTLDLTGATGWTTLGLHLGCFSFGGAVPTQVSAWVDIPVEARAEVLVRVMGGSGDGATTPTFSYLGFQVAGSPQFAANSLANVATGRDFVFFGGSQIGGGGTPGAGAGQFGTVDPAITAALNPLLTLGHAASGITWIKNGVTQTTVPTEHGADLGFIWAMVQAGKHVGMRVLGRYVSATKAQDWVSTHFATMVADVTSAGMTPKCLHYVLGSTDANSDATVGRLDNDLRALQSLKDVSYPTAGLVVMGQVTTDLVTYPKLVEARAVGQRRFEDTIDGRRCWVDRTASSAFVQSDLDHLTSAGGIVQGGTFAAPTIAAGIPA